MKAMRFIIILVTLAFSISAAAQKRNKLTRAEYIETYKDISMEEMKRTGIPASITLAQGILESGNGNSTLAVKANNHFGIKCHDWTGPSVRHDDDAKNECFRKYKSAQKSYLDHSDFLTGRSRYAFLFDLSPDDYKGWAKGLKKAGYATSPTYAKALIGIIEDNELYKYDQIVLITKSKGSKKDKSASIAASGRTIMYNNRVKYIVAKESDTYASLTDELSFFSWQLPRYNESEMIDTLSAGDLVYLQPKRKRTYGKNRSHMVTEGEDLHDIAQKYGVREEKLRQRNNIPEGKEPAPGAVVLLRGKLKRGAEPSMIEGEPKENKIELFKDPVEDKKEFEIEYDLGG
jgi:hypothetical protein